MRRKAWIVIRNGEVLPFFYAHLDDSPVTAEGFSKSKEVQIAGPVNVDVPPGHDMVPMCHPYRWDSLRKCWIVLVGTGFDDVNKSILRSMRT